MGGVDGDSDTLCARPGERVVEGSHNAVSQVGHFHSGVAHARVQQRAQPQIACSAFPAPSDTTLKGLGAANEPPRLPALLSLHPVTQPSKAWVLLMSPPDCLLCFPCTQ